MGDVMPSAARRLARFVIGLRLDDVPSSVVTKAALLALDTLGCALASTRYDFGRAAVQTAERLGGPQESTLVGSKVRVAAANAVLRSEEHTSELQSRLHLVCRLLLEKKKQINIHTKTNINIRC